jgi:xylulokinase
MTPYMLENDFTCIPYIFPDTFLSSLEITTCGILKNWARDVLFRDIRKECEEKGENFFAVMDARACGITTEVMLLPQFGSSGNPDLSMDARGTIAGLSIHTKPEEIYLAILEGMAFQSYLAYERLSVLGTKMECITATGGGAASDLTLQIRADVFNKTVVTLRNDESGTLGCMMMAAVADGAYGSAQEAISRAVKIRREYHPDPGKHRYYMEKYEKYRRLYELMHAFK